MPIQEGIDDQIRELAAALGADAVRNSDGTWLPEIASELVDKVYSTYFPARGDQEWALAHLCLSWHEPGIRPSWRTSPL